MHIHIFWDSSAPGGFQVPFARTISAMLGMRATIGDNPVRMMGYNQARKQINAQALLDSIQAYKHRHNLTDPVLLVVSSDLFQDGRRFVFGLARESVGSAVVSVARLGNEYYGKPAHDDDLIDRLSKEGAHEIGHLFGLDHCTVPECIMFRPNTLDELDCKKKMFCDACREQLDQNKNQKKS
jgi:archaemetzincin